MAAGMKGAAAGLEKAEACGLEEKRGGGGEAGGARRRRGRRAGGAEAEHAVVHNAGGRHQRVQRNWQQRMQRTFTRPARPACWYTLLLSILAGSVRSCGWATGHATAVSRDAEAAGVEKRWRGWADAAECSVAGERKLREGRGISSARRQAGGGRR